jgi:hypothetical protein
MFLTPLETDQADSSSLCAPQNEIATNPQGDGRQAYNPSFAKEDTKSTKKEY